MLDPAMTYLDNCISLILGLPRGYGSLDGIGPEPPVTQAPPPYDGDYL